MHPSQQKDIYNPSAVKELFNEMSTTYGVVNMIASLGFTIIWRKYVIAKLDRNRAPGVMVDLMSGMGELFSVIRSDLKPPEKLVGIDFSSKMCDQAKVEAGRNQFETEVIEADIFDKNIADGSADTVVCSFGLKTFSQEQQARFAKELARILKPGGQFSFIEISVPRNSLLRFGLQFYLKLFIPMIGKICLGNPDNYRHLGVYTGKFGNSRFFHEQVQAAGLESDYFEHFFGCATGVHGRKPN
ncbi:MAG: class I SAM-dependent methyltransferase [Bdellovibrionaceae bacterium]|nr:class I SAM-dependent methyltransferase [Pseudobdellovibrionaceae bacterium]